MKDSICREYIRYPEFFDTPDRLPIIAVSTKLTLAYQFKADFVVIPSGYLKFYKTRRNFTNIKSNVYRLLRNTCLILLNFRL